MRVVTLSSALVLLLSASVSYSSSASATPDERGPVQDRVTNGAAAKKASVAKQHSMMKAAPLKAVGATSAKQKAAHKQVSAQKQAPAHKQRAVHKPDPAVTTAAKKARVAKHSQGASALASVDAQLPGETPAPQVRRARADSAGLNSAPAFRMPHLFASPDPVMEARRWIGTNPTDRERLWCARFMNFVLERSGFKGTGSDAAKSFASYGHRVSGPKVGAIAVMTRGKGGGHVGIISGIDDHGNPIVISGNNFGRKVGESTYARSRIYAYVMPQR